MLDFVLPLNLVRWDWGGAVTVVIDEIAERQVPDPVALQQVVGGDWVLILDHNRLIIEVEYIRRKKSGIE